MDIFQTCLINGVSIDMQRVPRDLNSAADDISTFIDHDDYTINDTGHWSNFIYDWVILPNFPN